MTGRARKTARRTLGLLGLMAGSLADGALATIDVALPVAAGGAVFVACTGMALLMLRSGDEIPAEDAASLAR